MKGPLSWKDIFNNIVVKSDKTDIYGHKWEIIKTSGGKKFFIRRSDSTAEVHKEPIILHYKCKSCNIKATDYGEGIIPDSKKDRDLTCDEIIIK